MLHGNKAVITCNNNVITHSITSLHLFYCCFILYCKKGHKFIYSMLYNNNTRRLCNRGPRRFKWSVFVNVTVSDAALLAIFTTASKNVSDMGLIKLKEGQD